jgi:hypothetical protein
MSFSYRLNQSLNVDGRVRSGSADIEGGMAVSLAEPISNDGTDDLQFGFALNVDQCVFFYMVSDIDCTVKTNSSSVPDLEIQLVASVPFVWHALSYTSFAVEDDITKLYVTNDTTGDEGTLYIEALVDPTA